MQFAFTIRSMADPFVITDSSGQPRYQVRSVPDVAERLSLRAGGGELAAVVRDAMSSGFEVLVASERVALVRARGLIRHRYLIDAPGEGLSVLGSVDDGAYALAAGASAESGTHRGQVRRAATLRGRSVGYETEVVVADGEEPVRVIAIVLGLEHLCEDRRVAMGELKVGWRVMRAFGVHVPGI